MDRYDIESILKEHGVLLKSDYKGIAKELSKIMYSNESIKAVFLTNGGWWVLMSRRIIIFTRSWGGYIVDEIINHSQIERLYYKINKGFFSSSMDIYIKIKNEKTRTYNVNNAISFNYVARTIDNLKYVKSKRKKKKS